jgi:folate-binding protein YgfZ
MADVFCLDRTLIRVSGPDARSFLQNLLTQDLDKLDEARALYAALLTPQGKIIADMVLWAHSDGGVVIDADDARGADLLRRLAMYKLRAQVDLADVTADHVILVSDARFEGAVPDPRLAAIGWRGLAPHGGDYGDGGAWYNDRLMDLGVPDLARDAQAEEAFALEGLLEELNGVAFHKGCFVGQENVSRMKRRATTRKKFCPIVFAGEAPQYGATIRAGESEIGTIRSGKTGRAISFLRLDRATESADSLTVEGRGVRLDPPPWLFLPQAQDD